MDTKKEIFAYVNELIKEENGVEIKPTDKLADAGLDSLATVFLLTSLDSEYGILENVPNGKEYEQLGLDKITLRELVHLCMVSLLRKSETTK